MKPSLTFLKVLILFILSGLAKSAKVASPWTRGGIVPPGSLTTQQQYRRTIRQHRYAAGGLPKAPSPMVKCQAVGVVATLASLYGAGGVFFILAKAVKEVVPIALEPFSEGAIPLSQFELGSYILMCLWKAYEEGYKGFQLSFAPLVVKRSFTLVPGKNGTRWYHFLLAPLYSLGMIHAPKRRMLFSWSFPVGVALIIAAVRKLPYPWRNIVDAGVLSGLGWGSLSIAILYLKALVTGSQDAETEAHLPEWCNGA